MQTGDLGTSQDITLRNPDGYFNIILIRYGFLGFLLYLGFFFYKIFLAIKSKEQLKAWCIFLILCLSVVDPIFITPINVILIASIIKGVNVDRKELLASNYDFYSKKG